MSFLFPFLKNITIFASFHVFGMCRSVMHFVYSFASCFISCFQCFNVNLIFSRFFPIFHFPKRGFHFPCHYWWYFFGVCLYCYSLLMKVIKVINILVKFLVKLLLQLLLIKVAKYNIYKSYLDKSQYTLH